MSFFGGKKSGGTKPQYTGIDTQTSTSVIPVPICWGAQRCAPNIVWYGDFKSKKNKQKTGKGFASPSQTYYTYSASVILGLCEGQINSVVRAWKDESKYASYTNLGFTMFDGSDPQSAWGYLTANHPSQALDYPGLSYLAQANYDLGQSNNLSNHSFEVFGRLYNTQVNGTGDADPALIIDEYLTDPRIGVPIPVSSIDYAWLFSGPDAATTGDSAAQTYWRAIGFGMSPCLSDQEKASETLKRWCELLNTDPVWTGYNIKFIPRGDEQISANGVIYLPPNTIQYNLTSNDFLGSDDDPIEVQRSDPADAINSLKLKINDRNNEYNPAPVDWRDQGLIDQYTIRPGDDIDAPEICGLGMAAVVVSLIGQKKAYIRNQYLFQLPVSYCLLEPGDLVTATDPAFGTAVIKIIDVTETDDGSMEITAEEYPAGTGGSGGFTAQAPSADRTNPSTPAGPINPPLIFEPPTSMSGFIPQIWAAVSGGDGTTADPFWGGCFVFVSLDNANYQQIGQVDTPARQGKLTANLPTYGGANPDNTNTLSVTLAMSAGELQSVDPIAAANGDTVCYVGGELISFEDATLTGPSVYNLQTLYRGLNGSTIAAHASGSNFARLDENIFKFDLPDSYIGQTIYLKFQSYNIWGIGVEDLSSVTPYTYVPTGAGSTASPPGAVTLTSSTNVSGLIVLSGTFAASSESTLTGYDVEIAVGPSFTSWVSAGRISADSTTAVVTGVNPSTDYRMRVRAVSSSAFVSPSAWVVSATHTTPASAGRPFGPSFSGPITAITAGQEFTAFDPGVAWTLKSGMPNSQGNIGGTGAIAPSATTDFDIRVNGVSVGTMRFAASSFTATFIKGSDSVIALGSRLSVVPPASLNGMSGMLDFTLLGER